MRNVVKILFHKAEGLQNEPLRRWRACDWLQWGPWGHPHYRAEWGGFVLSLTHPVADPATDFPAGTAGDRTEGEKIQVSADFFLPLKNNSKPVS